RMGPQIELVIVSKETWTMLWKRWTSALKEGQTFCDGGRYFDKLLPRIRKDAKSNPTYDEIVGKYTVIFVLLQPVDFMTETCTQWPCEGPKNNKETLTLAYPTEEGLQQ
ncbi:hypothetical protein PMAYCL1PPCAC_04800, partial [Pristionchus mayeri]